MRRKTQKIRKFLHIVLLLTLVMTVLFLLTPVIFNQLLPPLLSRYGLHDIVVHVDQISPSHLSGTISLQRHNQRPAASGQFRLGFSPRTFLHRQFDSLTLQNWTIRLLRTDSTLQLDGFALPPSPSPASGRAPSSLSSLPLALDNIAIKNVRLVLAQHGRQPHDITMQGHIIPHLIKESTAGYRLAGAEAELDWEGSVTATWSGRLSLEPAGVRLAILGTPSPADISCLLGLSPAIRLHSALALEAELLVDERLQTIQQVRGKLVLPGLTLRRGPLTVTGSEGEPLTVSVQGTGKSLDIGLGGLQLAAPVPARISGSASCKPAAGTCDGSLVVASPNLQKAASIAFSGTFGGTQPELAFHLEGEKQQISWQTTVVGLGPHALSGHLLLTEKGPVASGALRLTSVDLPGQNLALAELSGDFSSTTTADPQKTPQATGNLAVKQIRVNGATIASLEATVSAEPSILRYAGEIKGKQGLKLKLSGSRERLAEAPATLSFTIPTRRISTAVLPRFIKIPKGLTFSGNLAGRGDLRYLAGRLTGAATLSFDQGTLDLPEQKIHLVGIGTTVTLPDLPQLMSRPSQQLRIATMDIGNLKFSNGLIAFRLEGDRSLTIERSRFAWCGGRVESGGLRLSLTDPELATTLYCDRLQFTQLLSQLGISNAEGSGSLNGRLPLVYDGKKMTFDDGFLFSTPGDGGIIRFENTALLRQGLPTTEQATALDYSVSAMQDFAYNWTRLSFVSEGDSLLIGMQLDGKPASPLPFTYQGGQLVRATEGVGIQHPIRLDVNFRLPFGDIFTYGQRLQKAMKR
ncbi:MAG: YdbH domain-containing protein [Desulfopila sp.]